MPAAAHAHKAGQGKDAAAAAATVVASSSTTTTAPPPLDPNSHEAIVQRLSPQTLRDIEALDPRTYGFERGECCGAIPSTIANSMQLTEHVVYGVRMPYTQWAKHMQNVPHYATLERCVAAANKNAKFTACQVAEDEGEWLMRFRIDEKFGCLVAMQYFLHHENDKAALPWLDKGNFAYERSNDYFIFICAHPTRDARCGYCGAVLVDLFRRALRERLGVEGARAVSVYPCSHVGGHVYAGNVLVYSRHGGVCFGLFKPVDIDAVIDAIVEGRGAIPISLQSRVRGRMLIRGSILDCSIM